jgi:predicted alpha/beta superfamily hydrolase
MDEHGHALEGYSAGGWFVVYALLQRPGAFVGYLAGAPALYFCNDLIWSLEEEHAAAHDDLPGRLFMGAGDGEMTVEFYFGCFSSMAKMVERLTLRGYPSLDLSVKIFPGASHATGRPFAISAGVQSLWGDALERA